MAYCVGCSSDLAVQLQQDSLVAAFNGGWFYECVWETSTRQDAELMFKVFRQGFQRVMLRENTRACHQTLCVTPLVDPYADPTCSAAALAIASLC